MHDSQKEATTISQKIIHALLDGHQPEEIAVLVRTTAQTRGIEDSFAYHEIPYRVIGGLRFYERSENKDAIAYWRIALLPTR